MKKILLFFSIFLLTSLSFAQIGLPIQTSLLPKNSLVVNYDFLNAAGYTRGGTAVTNLAGTASGNATIYNSPNFINSLGYIMFNGTNQYLMSPNLRTYFKALNGAVQKSFTMSLWVYPTSSNGVVISEHDSQTLNLNYYLTIIELVGGVLRYRLNNSSYIESPPISLNQWYHIAMVYDGTRLKAYLNGTLQGTLVYDRLIPVSTQFFGIGSQSNTNLGSGAYGNFHLAQFKLHNLPLTDFEIQEEYELRSNEYDYTIHSPSTNTSPTYWGVSSAWASETTFSQDHYTPWLNNTRLGWAAGSNDVNQWITLNYDEPAFIKGVVIQPRANSGGQFVTKVHVETSSTGSAPWTRVVSDATVGTTTTDDARVIFPKSVFARAVRILPVTWTNHITMRLGLLAKPNNLVTDGLVLRLDADNIRSYQGTGTTFKDLSSYSSDFTLVGSPTYDPNGFLTFNGTNQYASRVNTASLKPSSAISFEQWLNADNWNAGTSSSNYKCSLSCTAGGGYSHNIWSGSFYSYIYAGGRYLVPSASVSNFSGWHHFVTTFDGRYAKLFIDGSLANTVDYGSANTTMTYAANSIFLGAEAAAGTAPEGFYWQGKIATTSIYNKALSDAEVAQNFNVTKIRYNIIQDGLVANFINPPSSGTTWTDASGNGNNATINGSPTYTSANGGGYITSTNSYISLPYNLPNTFTVSVACSLNPSSYWATLWGNESWNAGKGYIAYFSSNTILNIGSPTSTALGITVSGINTVHIWDFVVNGTSYTLYRDGVSISTGTFSASAGGLSTTGLYFGARHTNTGAGAQDFAPGTYYSMRVYDRPLSSDEINTNFTVLRGNYGL